MTTSEELIKNLEMLRRKLNELSDRLNDSGVERTFHLRRIMGEDCSSVRKSTNLFLDEDFDDLANLVQECQDLFDLCGAHGGPNG
jgi:hypothetical protein